MDAGHIISAGLPLTHPRGPIDWPGLARRWPELVRGCTPERLEAYRGRQVYLAGPISQHVRDGQPDIPMTFALQTQTALLGLGLSPVNAVLLTLGPVALWQDELTGQLDAMPHDWWLRRCEPWLAASAALVVIPAPGWDESEGVWAEAWWMLERGRPVFVPEIPAADAGGTP